MAASPSTSSDEQLPLGSLLDGRYRIDAVLGTGGMGRVYRAEHTKIGKSVAIKILHADLGRNREASQRFQREAIASGRLDHPNIVGVSDFGVLDDGACFLVMEVLEGESLGDRLQREGRIHWVEAIEILRGVLHGLRHAHERGVVHRDIKPDNVYLAHKDGDPVIKILDFGIAKLYAGTDEDPASTRAGLTVGTPAYLSPEQAVGGEITPKSDLYSASILLYEMLAGHAPFEDKDPLAMLGAHVSKVPPPFAESAPGVDIPPALEQIVQHGLQKRAVERIASAADYLALLDAVSPPLQAMPRFATAPALPVAARITTTTGTPFVPVTSGHATTPLAFTPSPIDVPPSGSAAMAAMSAMASGPSAAPVLLPGSGPHSAPVPGMISGPHSAPVPGMISGPHSVPGMISGPHSAPVPAALTGVLPATGPISMELPVERARRAVSLADVVEPIPRSWIVRSGVFVGVAAVAALALAIVSHCNGGAPPPAVATAPVAPPAAKPAPARPTLPPAKPAAARPVLPPANPAPPPAEPPANPAEPAPPPPPAQTVAKPAAPAKDPRLVALVRELETSRTCGARKAAIPKLVALRDAGAIPALKRARYRMYGGVLGLGQDNANACLKADAERAIKALGGSLR